MIWPLWSSRDNRSQIIHLPTKIILSWCYFVITSLWKLKKCSQSFVLPLPMLTTLIRESEGIPRKGKGISFLACESPSHVPQIGCGWWKDKSGENLVLVLIGAGGSGRDRQDLGLIALVGIVCPFLQDWCHLALCGIYHPTIPACSPFLICHVRS